MARTSKAPASRAERGSYLLEWRTKKGLTLAQVAARLEYLAGDNPEYAKKLPSTGASLSRIEQGKQPYSQPVLEALAEIYDTEPGNLLQSNPLVEQSVVDFVARLTERDQQRIMDIARTVLAVGGEK